MDAETAECSKRFLCEVRIVSFFHMNYRTFDAKSTVSSVFSIENHILINCFFTISNRFSKVGRLKFWKKKRTSFVKI